MWVILASHMLDALFHRLTCHILLKTHWGSLSTAFIPHHARPFICNRSALALVCSFSPVHFFPWVFQSAHLPRKPPCSSSCPSHLPSGLFPRVLVPGMGRERLCRERREAAAGPQRERQRPAQPRLAGCALRGSWWSRSCSRLEQGREDSQLLSQAQECYLFFRDRQVLLLTRSVLQRHTRPPAGAARTWCFSEVWEKKDHIKRGSTQKCRYCCYYVDREDTKQMEIRIISRNTITIGEYDCNCRQREIFSQ